MKRICSREYDQAMWLFHRFTAHASELRIDEIATWPDFIPFSFCFLLYSDLTIQSVPIGLEKHDTQGQFEQHGSARVDVGVFRLGVLAQ